MSSYLPNMISTLSTVLPMLGALARWERLGRDLVAFAAVLALYMCSDLVGMTTALQHIRNLWLMNILCCLDYPVLVWILYLWERNPRFRRMTVLFIPVGLGLWLMTLWKVGGLRNFNYAGRSIESIILVGLSIRALHRLAIAGDVNLWTDYRFWVALGILVSFGGSIFAYSFGFLMESRKMLAIWPLHLVSNIVSSLLYTGGFLCLRRPLSTGG